MSKKLNKNARAWVRALRSGKYKQGRDYLRQEDRFCCLGVACELAIKAGVIAKPVSSDGKTFRYADSRFELPANVTTWLGLTTSTGAFCEKGDKQCLSDLNDRGKRFKTIARIIESKPDRLFVS